MPSADDLREALRRIDGRGYRSYRDLRGAWAFDGFDLHVDHVQADPFAPPSTLRLRVPMATAALPPALFDSRVRRSALADHIARRVRAEIGAAEDDVSRSPGRESGAGARGREGRGHRAAIAIDAGGQEVLERSAVAIDPAWIEARIEVGLPAAGRRVLGRAAEALLCEALPSLVARALVFDAEAVAAARRFVECVENQAHIREQLTALGLVAFVADGAILPRASGHSQRPMPLAEARPFESPASHAVEIDLPHEIDAPAGPTRRLRGMGIRRGVTLIVGGGYHGKSTLLRALERGVYPHVPGDGREYVVASPGLVKLRAEDGRAVTGVDIHAFVSALPAIDGARATRSTHAFHTADASGSTSQASSLAEAVEAGATGLLLDEDTSATNFMLRDARMQQLVHRDHEPITPFVDRVRELHDALGVSTVLVMGGCGDYFDVADSVIMMRDFGAEDVTAEAKRIAGAHATGRRVETRAPLAAFTPRSPCTASLDASRGRREVAIAAKGREHLVYGNQDVDLRHVEQLVDASQTRAIGFALLLAGDEFMSRGAGAPARSLAEVLDAVEAWIDERGIDALDARRRARGGEAHPGRLARPRRFEIAAALNRMRTLEVDAIDR